MQKGPELVYQQSKDQNNYITKDKFKKISEFVIPTTQFCNKKVSLHLGNAYLLGYPIFLNNPNYERNRFEFNFCLLIDEDEYENHNYLYDCLIKKINTTFEDLEIFHHFKFMKNCFPLVIQFIEELYSNLTSNQSVLNICGSQKGTYHSRVHIGYIEYIKAGKTLFKNDYFNDEGDYPSYGPGMMLSGANWNWDDLESDYYEDMIDDLRFYVESFEE